ncbi:kinase-like domain-containing protein [Rhizophagus irregularis DAOM 181602=DAOM 197198]|nr:kinase-like domain-containing protein [Rhizophagus irregularis DAOM 181602=DAOM 197198]
MDSLINGIKKLFNSDEEICEICNYTCYTKRFQQNFINWSSNNDVIDNFIKNTQLSAHGDVKKALGWIPYYKFYDIEDITKDRVDDDVYIRLYGITQDPETKDYMMVLDYAESGSLRHYLNVSYNELNWESKINCLYCIASGLENIHKNELILEIYILVIW